MNSPEKRRLIGRLVEAYCLGRDDARRGRRRRGGHDDEFRAYRAGVRDELARMAEPKLEQAELALGDTRMPMDVKRYPEDWKRITAQVRERAGHRCECLGECGRGHAGRCEARQGDPLERSSRHVILTTAHLWRGPCADHHAAGIKCGELEHLKSMCQACHLTYDVPLHVANARRTRHERKASADLFDVDTDSAAQ